MTENLKTNYGSSPNSEQTSYENDNSIFLVQADGTIIESVNFMRGGHGNFEEKNRQMSWYSSRGRGNYNNFNRGNFTQNRGSYTQNRGGYNQNQGYQNYGNQNQGYNQNYSNQGGQYHGYNNQGYREKRYFYRDPRGNKIYVQPRGQNQNKNQDNQEDPWYPCRFHKTFEHNGMNCPHPREERVKIMLQEKRCINCLRLGHIHQNCDSEIDCRNCNLYNKKSRHNTTLCDRPEHPDLRKSRFETMRGQQNSSKPDDQTTTQAKTQDNSRKRSQNSAPAKKEEVKKLKIEPQNTQDTVMINLESAYASVDITEEMRREMDEDSEVEIENPEFDKD